MSSWAKLTAVIALGALTSVGEGLPAPPQGHALSLRSPGTNKSVIIQMFEWTWDSVAAECTNFIGPAGYGFVQGRFRRLQLLGTDTDIVCSAVSPPQETISGDQWWTDYQPVSYILTSKRGNRDQFASMISTCHAAGVGVIVGEYHRSSRASEPHLLIALTSVIDTIWNHMAGVDSGTGVAGSSFTHYNYPGIYQNQDFHHCGLEPGDDIVNYDNAVEVQTCELVNLAE